MNPTGSTTTTHREYDYYWSSIFFIFIVPALGGLLFGYDIGATSFAVVSSPLLVVSSSSGEGGGGGGGGGGGEEESASPVLIGLFVSTPSAGALFGSIIVYFIADNIGRLNELRIGSLFYIVGAILESNTTSYTIMFLGRLLYGLGIGFSMHGAPTYLGEMLPSSIRGAFVSLKEVFIVLGILLGYISGYIFSGSNESNSNNFVYLYMLSLIGSSIMLLLSFSIPYSTRWLLSKGRNQEARKALSYIYFDPDSKYNSLIVAYNEQQQQQQSSSSTYNDSSSSIFHPSRRAALTAGIGLVVLQQVTGQPSVLSYATPMFESVGLDSFSSVLVALFKLVATTTAVFTVEYYGRKQLLYVGCSLMLLALTVLTLTLGSGDATTGTNNNSDNNGSGENVDDTTTTTTTIRTTAILIAMFVYIGGYQIGFGPMSWLIMSEVFPQSIRGQAVAVAVQVNFLLNAIVQFGVPVLASIWGLSTTFLLFGILTAYSIYFVYWYVLETKGLSLEEIEHMFRHHHQGQQQQQSYGRKATGHDTYSENTIGGSGSDDYDEDEEQQQLLTEMQPTRRIATTKTREGNVAAGTLQSPYQK